MCGCGLDFLDFNDVPIQGPIKKQQSCDFIQPIKDRVLASWVRFTAATKCAFTSHKLHQRLDTGYHYLVRADAWPWHLRSIGFQPTVARGANLLGNFFDGISRDSALKGGSVKMCN